MKNLAFYKYAYIALTCLCFFLVCSVPQWLSAQRRQGIKRIPVSFIIIFIVSILMIWIVGTFLLLFPRLFENLLS